MTDPIQILKIDKDGKKVYNKANFKIMLERLGFEEAIIKDAVKKIKANGYTIPTITNTKTKSASTKKSEPKKKSLLKKNASRSANVSTGTIAKKARQIKKNPTKPKNKK